VKKVLITGGSGTVGSSFIEYYKDKYHFCVFSRNESLQDALKKKYKVDSYLGSVENKEDLYFAYDKFKPDIVIHAAALKHVDIAEKQPIQSVNMNVLGSLNVISASLEFNVPINIGISTDKACNHQNVYGITKYLMEKMFLESNSDKIKFATCRFANVANSNGSVIPYWKDLAKKGLPIKLTDINMNRMIFSRKDACQLINTSIDICEKENGGFVLSKKMKTVNMYDLACSISNNIEIVGIRPGEKLNEDLVSEKEVPYCQLIENDYVKIYKNIYNKNDKLKLPINSLNAEKMTTEEILTLLES
jgi:UDP-N-acetylglucosamine 4,6-dehydratase